MRAALMLYLFQFLSESDHCLTYFLQLFLFLAVYYPVILYGCQLAGLLETVHVLNHGIQLHLYVSVHYYPLQYSPVAVKVLTAVSGCRDYLFLGIVQI